MSVVNLSDLLFGDLLTEKNVKPWWEKLRGYIFAGSTAFALSATYLTLNGVSVNCLPVETSNVSYACEYSLRQAAWMNSYCSNRLPWFVNYFGGMCLATVLILLYVSSLWLQVPKVIDSFATFVDLENKVAELGMTSDDMHEESCRPLNRDSKDDKQLKLREICGALWKGGRDVELDNEYSQRNCRLIILSLATVGFFSLILGFMIRQDDTYTCVLDEEDRALIHGDHIFANSFHCVAPMARRLMAFNVIFIGSIILQIVPIALGKREWNKQKKNLSKFPNIDFMRFFWKHAQPTHSKKFSRLLKHVCGDSAIKSIKDNLAEIVQKNDHILIETFVSLSPNKSEAGTFLIEGIAVLYQGNLERYIPRLHQHLSEEDKENLEKYEKAVITAIKCLPKETDECKYKDFLIPAVKRSRWYLLTKVLGDFVTKYSVIKGYNLLNTLDPDYDILDETNRSLLYYFIGETGLHPIVRKVNQNCPTDFKLYVHDSGRSSHVTAMAIFDRTDISVSEITGEQIFTSTVGKSQAAIVILLEEFRAIMNIPQSPRHDNFDIKLSKFKFQKWSDAAREFAYDAYHSQRGRWSTFVTLLNCYVVSDSDRGSTGLIPCGVTDLDSNIIYQAIPYTSVPRPFVPTAARHIIECLSRREREACRNTIRSSLEGEEMESMLLFVDVCNAREQSQMTFDDLPTGGERSITPDNTSRDDSANTNQPSTSSSSGNATITNRPHDDATSRQHSAEGDTRIEMDATAEDEPLLDED